MQHTCTLELVVDLIGGKWKMIILWRLRHGVLRFSELKKKMPGISQKMLTQQLRDLEETNLIVRTVYPAVPPKVEYMLTEEARNLLPALSDMCNWGKKYASTHKIEKCSNE